MTEQIREPFSAAMMGTLLNLFLGGLGSLSLHLLVALFETGALPQSMGDAFRISPLAFCLGAGLSGIFTGAWIRRRAGKNSIEVSRIVAQITSVVVIGRIVSASEASISAWDFVAPGLNIGALLLAAGSLKNPSPDDEPVVRSSSRS